MRRQDIIRIGLVLLATCLISPKKPLRTLVGFSIIGYFATDSLVLRSQESFIKIGLKGQDKSKRPPVPYIAESMGVVAAVSYMFLMFLIIPFVFFKDLLYLNSHMDLYNSIGLESVEVLLRKNFPHNKLAQYLSGMLCLQSTTLLGIFDDLFDIRWRHKILIPAIAAMPMLIVYYVDKGITSIVVPQFVLKMPAGEYLVTIVAFIATLINKLATKMSGLSFSSLSSATSWEKLPLLLDLGVFYYIYMAAVSIFSPHSINILAGVNGIEVGQSLVLATILLVNDSLYLVSSRVLLPAYESHIQSAIFLIPFIGVSQGLLRHNWYPSKVFVGDTYCYFAGMVFAIVGILGHFSKTLLLFSVPQIVNFLYSAPQLFGLLPCPRHRLPRFDLNDGLMHPSHACVPESSLNKLQRALIYTLHYVHLLNVYTDDKGYLYFSNFTLINLYLYWAGPLKENTLCLLLLLLQLCVGLSFIFLRHTLGPWIFGYDNLSLSVK